MGTTKKPKKKLVEGALYLVETVEDTDTASHSIHRILRWTSRGWRDERGRKPLFACNSVVRRVRPSNATPYWGVVLLREYARKLEAIGDGLAFWGTPTKRAPLAAQWREARKAKL